MRERSGDDVLVLWDIDHTLIVGGGVSREAYAAAFTGITGRPLEAMAEMAGRTERFIATETLGLNGIGPDPEITARLITAVTAELHARADLLAEAGHVLPGAAEALRALAGVPGVHQSALTGNSRALAELKLGVFGLAEHIDLAVGAYGDDTLDRTDLLPVARARARAQRGTGYDGTRTVIIGDTVLDVATATTGGARAVGVATGATSAEALASAGADVVLPDLADTAAVLRAVLDT